MACLCLRSLQLEYTTLQGQLAEARDQYQAVEVERAKLEHRCEVSNLFRLSFRCDVCTSPVLCYVR